MIKIIGTHKRNNIKKYNNNNYDNKSDKKMRMMRAVRIKLIIGTIRKGTMMIGIFKMVMIIK